MATGGGNSVHEIEATERNEKKALLSPPHFTMSTPSTNYTPSSVVLVSIAEREWVNKSTQ